jgi:hypothetical protein
VLVHYRWRDASQQFSIGETAAGAPDEYAGDWKALERGGEQLLVWEPEHERGRFRPPSRVRVERDGTQVTIQSQDLELERLLELVDLLVPAPTEPPPLTPAA